MCSVREGSDGEDRAAWTWCGEGCRLDDGTTTGVDSTVTDIQTTLMFHRAVKHVKPGGKDIAWPSEAARCNQ